MPVTEERRINQDRRKYALYYRTGLDRRQSLVLGKPTISMDIISDAYGGKAKPLQESILQQLHVNGVEFGASVVKAKRR